MPWGGASWPSPSASTAAAAAGPSWATTSEGYTHGPWPPAGLLELTPGALRRGGEARSRRDLVVDGLGRGLVGGDDQVQAQLGDVGQMGVVVGAQSGGADVDVADDLLELLLGGEGVRLLVHERLGQRGRRGWCRSGCTASRPGPRPRRAGSRSPGGRWRRRPRSPRRGDAPARPCSRALLDEAVELEGGELRRHRGVTGARHGRQRAPALGLLDRTSAHCATELPATATAGPGDGTG